jgi:hypothetical protein
MSRKKYTKETLALAAEIDAATDEGGTIQARDVVRIAPSLPPTEHTTMPGSRLARLLGDDVLQALVTEHGWYEGLLEEDRYGSSWNPSSNPDTAAAKRRAMRG